MVQVAKVFGMRLEAVVGHFFESISAYDRLVRELQNHGRVAQHHWDSPPSREEWVATVRQASAALAERLEVLCDIGDGVEPKDVLEHHILSLQETSALFAWPDQRETQEHILRCSDNVARTLAPVLRMGESSGNPANEQFASTLQALAQIAVDHAQQHLNLIETMDRPWVMESIV